MTENRRRALAESYYELGEIRRLVNSCDQQLVSTRSVEKIARPGQRPQTRETRDAKQASG